MRLYVIGPDLQRPGNPLFRRLVAEQMLAPDSQQLVGVTFQ
jgi:hypothetical protein